MLKFEIPLVLSLYLYIRKMSKWLGIEIWDSELNKFYDSKIFENVESNFDRALLIQSKAGHGRGAHDLSDMK